MTAPAPARAYTDDWREAALCAQTDPEAFYPERGATAAQAKKVCTVCPVQAECLESAISKNEQYGVWGGTSRRDRNRIKRRRNAA